MPLTIVGIVFLATRGINPDDKPKDASGSKGFLTGMRFGSTPTGLALQF